MKYLIVAVLVIASLTNCSKNEDIPDDQVPPPGDIIPPELAVPKVNIESDIDALTVHYNALIEDADRVYWEFGDGLTSTELSPVHSYELPAKYRVTLTAYNDSIVSDSLFAVSNYTKEIIRVSVLDHIRWGTKTDPLTGVTISWRSLSSDDKIHWGYSESLELGEFSSVAQEDKLGGFIMNSYTFENLLPSSILYYRLYDSNNDTWTGIATFKTAPDPAANKFKFSAGGDSRTNVDDWQAVAEAIEVCDFSLYLGDLVDKGNIESDWEKWYYHGQSYISKNLAFHVRGNHDIGSIFPNNLVNPGNGLYYSFEFGNAIFIGLDDYKSDTWAEQSMFLEDVLESNQDKTWKFIFFHSPFFTSGDHIGEMDELIPTWWSLFDDNGVDLIFNGHEHNFMRSVPINLNVSDTSGVENYGSMPGEGRCQIIAGSYGAPRYPPHAGWFVDNSSQPFCYTTVEVDGNTLVFKAIDTDTGEVFDELTLSK